LIIFIIIFYLYKQEKKKEEEADEIDLSATISSMYHYLNKASDEYGNNPITIGD
jgi:hypothetical protein